MVPGRDAILRCEGQLPEVTFELLRAGEEEPIARLWSSHPSADLVVTYVGPKHAGNYSCRYRWWSPKPFVSKLSDPVELQVAGELFLWFCELGSSFLPLPRLCPLPGRPFPAPPPNTLVSVASLLGLRGKLKAGKGPGAESGLVS